MHLPEGFGKFDPMAIIQSGSVKDIEMQMKAQQYIIDNLYTKEELARLQKEAEQRYKGIDYDHFYHDRQACEVYIMLNKTLPNAWWPNEMKKDIQLCYKYKSFMLVELLHYMWYMKYHRDKNLFPIAKKKLIINPKDFDANHEDFDCDLYVNNFEVTEDKPSTFKKA